MMAIQTIKFSQMPSGGNIANNDMVPGLGSSGGSSINVLYNNPWTFLPPGSTADRPIPNPSMYYLLRLNTDLQVYEYYNPITPAWTELSGSGTGTVNPGLTNDLVFYPENGTTLSPIASAINSVLVTNASSVPSLSTTLPVGMTIPNATITSSTATLLSGQISATPVNPDDLVNKAYVDSSVAAGVTSATGTVNQVYINGVVGIPQTGALVFTLPQNIGTGSSPEFSALTLASSATHGVLIGEGSSPIVSVVLGAGDLLIGTTSGDPVAATLTPGTGISINSVSGVITISATGSIPITFDADSGTATPTSNSLTITGSSTGLTTTGSGSIIGLTGILNITHGGTGVSSVTTAPTATAFAGWDANNNLSANNFIGGFVTTVSSASPIVLTVSSAQQQYITGSSAQTVTMPVTSTLVQGMSWTIVNLSSATATVQSSGANSIVSLPPLSQATVTCILTSGTTAASWSDDFSQSTAGVSSITGTANQVIASASTGAVTLSLPQNINTTATPQFSNVLQGYTTTITAAGTTTLTTTSTYWQFFTGTTTQTVLMPVTSTLVLGQSWVIVNNSTGIVTIQSSGGNTITTLPANSRSTITCILTSGTSAASWASSSPFAGYKAPTLQTFTSGSGTYTTPTSPSPLYINVIMVGGGGGGSGSGTASIGTGGTGGSTTFGTSLLTCTGGTGGNGTGIGSGGTPTLNSPAIGISYSGMNGITAGSSSVGSTGGMGGISLFSGGASGGYNSGAGQSARANSGSGGGGAGGGTTFVGAAGGGSGAYINAFISAPSASYSYAVGASGTAGTAGTSGTAGGVGGSGVIFVYEYYQ